MSINPTKLRENLYKILDQVIETQIPVEIIRDGHKLQLNVKEPSKKKLDNLAAHPGTIIGDPESLIYNNWESEWEKDQEI